MDLKEVLKNKRILIAIFALALFGLILILAFLTTQFSVKVVSITPTSEAQEVPTNTTIQILFNRSIDTSKFKAEFTPAIEYTLTTKDQNKLIILKPKFALTARQLYLISITNPVKFKSTFTTVFLPLDQLAGKTYGYPEGQRQLDIQQEGLLKSWNAILDINSQLPITMPTFSARYVSKTNVYIVKMLGPNPEKSRQDFLDWVKSQGADPDKMPTYYTNASTPDFTLALINIPTPTTIVSPIEITFTDPVLLSTAEIITLSPLTPAFFNWNKDVNVLTIVPQSTWAYETNYQITIPATIERQTGGTLGREYNINFKTEDYTGI